MAEISQVKAKDIMTKNPEVMDIDECLSKVISVMNKKSIKHVILCDKNKYAGIIGYRQLIMHRKTQKDSKIGSSTFKPPLMSQDAEFSDIIKKMYQLNYKVLPVGDGSKIVGMICERDILKTVLEFGLLSDKKAEDFMTPNPLTLYDDETIGKAIVELRQHNVSRIPVLNKENKIIGLLQSMDVIKILLDEKFSKDSGTSSQSNCGGTICSVCENTGTSKIPVKSICESNFVVAKKSDLLIDKMKEIVSKDMPSLVVIDDERCPVGIISPKDVIQYLAVLLDEEEKIWVQMSGLDSIKSIEEFQKDEINSIIKRRVEKISNIVDIDNITIHAKVYDEEGNRKKYLFRCKLSSKNGLFYAKNNGWDPIDVVSTLMNEIEKITLKNTKKSKDLKIKNRRKEKYRE
ncbi:MAG: CBS domain-containing protein [Candidatus Aenigmarchaeota archaeon]|nr:CBS domain-containing protein [Candidatus Aenigmarchaeota archaeon]